MDPGTTLIYAERKGQLRWGGLIWQAEPEGDELKVEAAGWTSYLQQRHDLDGELGGRGPYVRTDPCKTARDIVAYAQSIPDGDLGLRVDSTTSKAMVGTPSEPWHSRWWETPVLGGQFDDLVKEPTQGTLRDTIETPQGGSCTVALRYTDWWVKLRARSLPGVAGSASDAVAGTPRRAGTTDLQAGSVTADSLAADAISGKHITGGTIDGAIVTGSTLRTGTSGSRVIVTPNPPAPMEQIPSLLLHSASDMEQAPGSLRANIRTDGKAYPALELTAPAVQLDRWERPDIAQLTLLSPQLDVQGTKVTVRTASSGGDATTTLAPENITVGTWVSHRGTDWCPIQLSANVTEGQVPPQVRVTSHRTIELSGYVDLKDPEVRRGVGFDGVSCRAD
ncbi:hypothetical protein FCH28_24465 [Streptomyces piniterrae]|uniref:Uncharacterized protein n=1 Tax=Streptomyces piniterrae TaxID=2571125 RepID=A0A4U0N6N5_9ACTN|nr:hypothetical protein FCH28_24465 [Streptomyces piniterrae]